MHSFDFTLFMLGSSFHPRWVPFSSLQPCYTLPLTFDCWFTASSANHSRAASACHSRFVGRRERLHPHVAFWKMPTPHSVKRWWASPSEHAHRADCVSMKGSSLLLSHSITLLIPSSSFSSSSFSSSSSTSSFFSLKQTHISVFFIKTNTNVISPCSDVNLWIGWISPADILHSMWRFFWWWACTGVFYWRQSK